MLMNVLKVVDVDDDSLVVEKSKDSDAVFVAAESDCGVAGVLLTPNEARAVAAHLVALAKEVDGGN